MNPLPSPADPLRTLRRVTVTLCALLLLIGSIGFAQPSPHQARKSPNVAIIPIAGPIDHVTAASVKRRIADAEKAGADAVVFEINSPGGEVGAVLEITTGIKRTSVPRTVAWVNPQAYSGGALIAVACGEIVTTTGTSFGDAAPVMMGVKNIGATERAKILSPLLADVVGSARKNGYDEKLVQGMLTLGVELWLIENPATGQRLCIDRAEYQMLFDDKPATSRPRLLGLPENNRNKSAGSTPSTAADRETSPRPTSPTDLIPASPQITPRTAAEASMGLSDPTQRPTLTPADKGQWRLVEYVSDGTALVTMNEVDMKALRLASASAVTLDDLKAYLGATNIITLTPAWYESIARVMGIIWVRGALIVLVIVGLAIEFIHPGLILPGTIAVLAIAGLILPDLMMGLAGWWEPALIVGGLGLLAVELFVLPGFGIAGGLGLLSLFAGLVLAFIPSAPSFPGMERSSDNLFWGLGFVVLGIVTAVGVGYYTSRNLRTLPVFGRLVLSDTRRDEDRDDENTLPEPLTPDNPLAGLFPGATGTTLTTLRPSGKADIQGRIIDVMVEGPVVEPNSQVRIVQIDGWRVIVEPA